MKSQKFSYVADGRTYIGSIRRAPTATPMAAVVLLPDWRGQSPLANDHAAHLVSLGCSVVISDLYGDGFNPTRPDEVGPMVKHLMDHRIEGTAALDACVEALKQEVPHGTPVFCLGFSAGGMVALDYGRCGARVDGIILCSALLKTAAEGMAAKIAPPVLILQGTQDQVSPMSVIADLISEMDAAGNDVRFVLYSQTHHAFDNPDAGSDPTARLCYSPASAVGARAAIAAFLDEQCRSN
jgi:dienelactone hydrolase